MPVSSRKSRNQTKSEPKTQNMKPEDQNRIPSSTSNLQLFKHKLISGKGFILDKQS